ncbi:MAG: hypothetical protein RML12_00105 [Xanthomonadales bacterium]|nr:hypothetical protein [Xanthomonadales bacterium]
MVGEVLLDPQQDGEASGIREVGIAGRRLDGRDHRVAGGIGVVEEQPAVARVEGVEGGPEQPALAGAAGEAARRDEASGSRAGAEPEEGCAEHGAVRLDDADGAPLLEHEQPTAAIVRGADRGDRGEAGGEALEAEIGRKLACGRGREKQKEREEREPPHGREPRETSRLCAGGGASEVKNP